MTNFYGSKPLEAICAFSSRLVFKTHLRNSSFIYFYGSLLKPKSQEHNFLRYNYRHMWRRQWQNDFHYGSIGFQWGGERWGAY